MYFLLGFMGLAVLGLASGCGGDGFTDAAAGAGGAAAEAGGAAGAGGGSSGSGGSALAGAGGSGGAGAGAPGGSSGAGGSGGDPAGAGGAAGTGAGAGAGVGGADAGNGGASGATAGAAGAATGGMGGTGGGGAGGGTAGEGGAAGTGGAPAECGAGEFRCVSDKLQKCSSVGLWTDQKDCDVGLCDATIGMCLGCKAGQVSGCADDKHQSVCASDGVNETSKPCAATNPYCFGAGECVACLTAAHCPAPQSPCQEAVCTSGTCGTIAVKDGTSVGAQTPGDCKKNVCLSGTLSFDADPEDVPPAPNDCSKGTCDGNNPSSVSLEPGTVCNLGDNIQGVCNGQGTCGECKPGAARCDGNQPQVCSDEGVWNAGNPCIASAPICSAGACVSVTGLAAGGHHTCAVLSDGTARCWGDNSSGQLGLGKAGGVEKKPVPITATTNVNGLALGGAHSCARLKDGTVKCWGANTHGELGGGDAMPHADAVKVMGSNNVVGLSAGGSHTCAIDTAGNFFCWGSNSDGQIGSGKSGDALAPAPIVFPGDLGGGVASAALGGKHTCAAAKNNAVFCWGDDDSGQVGDSDGLGDKPTPLQVTPSSAGSPPVMLVAGARHTCAQNAAATYCWGSNEKYQFGMAAKTPIQFPAPTATQFSVKGTMFVAGAEFTCLLRADKNIECAGDDSRGQLANGTTQFPIGTAEPYRAQYEPPGEEELYVTADELVAGGQHTCARFGSAVYCWGDNTFGQLGLGTSDGLKFYAKPVVW